MMAFQRLQAWQLANQLAHTVYDTTANFPSSEKYVLTAQMRRAAISVPANIAEGSVKRGPSEFRRFLDIALGSYAELANYIAFARKGTISAMQRTAILSNAVAKRES